MSRKIDLEKKFNDIIGQDCCGDYEFISYDDNTREITYKHLVCGNVMVKDRHKFLHHPYCNNRKCIDRKKIIPHKRDLKKEFNDIIGEDFGDYEFINYNDDKKEIIYKHLECDTIITKKNHAFVRNPFCNNRQCINKKHFNVSLGKKFNKFIGEDYNDYEFISYDAGIKEIVYKHLICNTIIIKKYSTFISQPLCNNKKCSAQRRNIPHKRDLKKEFNKIVGEDCKDYEFISYNDNEKTIIYKHKICENIMEKGRHRFLHYPLCNDSECVKKEAEKNCLQKYGVKNTALLPEVISKRKRTCKEKYGCEVVLQAEEIKQKIRQTNLEKYGVENISQNEEIKNKKIETCKKNFGVDNPMQSEDVRDKSVVTCIKKYGGKSPRSSDKINDKIKKTNLQKYGCVNPFQSEEIKIKIKETNLEKYGYENAFNNENVKNKFKKTCLDRYGVEHPSQIEEIKEKKYKTQKKNNSFNTSKPEQELKNFLLYIDSNLKYQYKDKERYPFNCDFYLPKYDLFIEYQGSWTHGREPFDKKNKNHLKILSEWKEKSEEINFKEKTKEYYKSAITTWTVRDVKKRNIANKNNLNYLEVFYTFDLNITKELIQEKINDFNSK